METGFIIVWREKHSPCLTKVHCLLRAPVSQNTCLPCTAPRLHETDRKAPHSTEKQSAEF